MNIRFFTWLFIGALCSIAGASYGYDRGLFAGTIQFPVGKDAHIESIPGIRIYYAGKIIPTETDNYSRKITFNIPEYRQRTIFYLLITPDVEFASRDNTIPFLRLKNNYPYKFYILELVQVPSKSKKRKRDGTMEYDHVWNVKEISLAEIQGRIPDETLIVCYNPEYVKGLEGGNSIEFPKIVIRPDIIKYVGSEALLHEKSNRWFLAALNTDTIHESSQAEIKIAPHATKTVMTMVT